MQRVWHVFETRKLVAAQNLFSFLWKIKNIIHLFCFFISWSILLCGLQCGLQVCAFSYVVMLIVVSLIVALHVHAICIFMYLFFHSSISVQYQISFLTLILSTPSAQLFSNSLFYWPIGVREYGVRIAGALVRRLFLLFNTTLTLLCCFIECLWVRGQSV